MELPERLCRGDFSCAVAAPTIALAGDVAIGANLSRHGGLVPLCSEGEDALRRAEKEEGPPVESGPYFLSVQISAGALFGWSSWKVSGLPPFLQAAAECERNRRIGEGSS